ncbi:MAG: Crp/Fnr family transcriptional regulator [Oceanococcaceae bacterium]
MATHCAQWNARKRSAIPHRHYPADSMLFWQDEPAAYVYLLRSGCIKQFVLDGDGNEHISDFHFPGDILALDSLHSPTYLSGAAALGPVSVCAIRRKRLLTSADPRDGLLLLPLLSRALAHSHRLAAEATAEQRIAQFLLDVRERLTASVPKSSQPAPGQDDAVVLPMGRSDLANHLRLVTETVSRMLSRFQADGLIRVARRRIVYRDLASLKQLASAAASRAEHRAEMRAA